MEKIIDLTPANIDSEHICCAFSDKKCFEGYQLKKDWLKKEFENGYVFRRINARAKVFMEYGPAEKAWLPVEAPGYLFINCFWVSGQYKGQGYAKELLRMALNDAGSQGKKGLVTVAGTKKYNFMSDTKWLLKHGFKTCETIVSGFSLLMYKIDEEADSPRFLNSVISGNCPGKNGLVVYYSNRCPFTEYHVRVSLAETAEKRNLPLTIIKLETQKEALEAPTPATIFSLFFNGQFVTTDLSVCLDSRFDKIIRI